MGPRPIVQFSPRAKLLIVGQAPGHITHDKGIPFDYPSGDRLRSWLGVERDVFYESEKVAIVPMGFAFRAPAKAATYNRAQNVRPLGEIPFYTHWKPSS